MRVCVIGAGVSGLAAIKACLEEGLDVVCFEASCDIGGLWRYTEGVTEKASVMRSTIINTSKEMSAYTDFPPPKKFANFMHNQYLMQYLADYCDKFGLRPHIRFGHRVVDVDRDDSGGQWRVSSVYRDHETAEMFDHIMVATGHHAIPNRPELNGESDYNGRIMHVHDYRDIHLNSELRGKRVLILGIGNSGGDIAVELSQLCDQVIVSTRKGTWVNNRVYDNGLPRDIVLTRRSKMLRNRVLGFTLVNYLLMRRLNKRLNHDLYSLTPAFMPMQQHSLINDTLPTRLISGTIIIKPDIESLTSDGAVFVDTSTEAVDAIIMATGYRIGWDFLKQPSLQITNNVIPFYKYVFPIAAGLSSMAFIGYIQPAGSTIPITDMQSRWAAMVFKGSVHLPSQQIMREDVAAKRLALEKRFVTSNRHSIQVDWIPYMDDLAHLICCKPRIGSLMLNDPYLGYHVFFGPCTPYQYRLSGPHSWAGARNAIVTQWDRIKYPLSTRPLPPNRAKPVRILMKKTRAPLLLTVLSIVAVFSACRV